MKKIKVFLKNRLSYIIIGFGSVLLLINVVNLIMMIEFETYIIDSGEYCFIITVGSMIIFCIGVLMEIFRDGKRIVIINKRQKVYLNQIIKHIQKGEIDLARYKYNFITNRYFKNFANGLICGNSLNNEDTKKEINRILNQ